MRALIRKRERSGVDAAVGGPGGEGAGGFVNGVPGLVQARGHGTVLIGESLIVVQGIQIEGSCLVVPTVRIHRGS